MDENIWVSSYGRGKVCVTIVVECVVEPLVNSRVLNEEIVSSLHQEHDFVFGQLPQTLLNLWILNHL